MRSPTVGFSRHMLFDGARGEGRSYVWHFFRDIGVFSTRWAERCFGKESGIVDDLVFQFGGEVTGVQIVHVAVGTSRLLNIRDVLDAEGSVRTFLKFVYSEIEHGDQTEKHCDDECNFDKGESLSSGFAWWGLIHLPRI